MKKPKQKKKHNQILRAMVIMAIVVVGMIICNFAMKPFVINEDRLAKVLNDHVRSKRPTQWFLTKATEDITPALIQTFEAKRAELLRSMEAWCPTNAIGKAIHEWLPQWGWGLGNRKNDKGIVVNALVVISGNETVVLVPQELNNPMTPDFFCNKPENGKIISIKATEMPEQIFAAFALHEIGHAVQYWQLKRKPGHDMEVEMHELSFDILNAYSYGAYGKCIDSILDREKVAPERRADWKTIYQHISTRDLADLDRSIDAENVSEGVERSLVTQHLLSLGIAAVNRKQQPPTEKLAVYEWHWQFFQKNR